VAFLGDDLTDEDGFLAIRGRGLGILVRKTFRPTAAEVHLHPPRELLEFLDQWCRYAPRRLVSREEVP
jgi:trehalose-6-phosphatase